MTHEEQLVHTVHSCITTALSAVKDAQKIIGIYPWLEFGDVNDELGLAVRHLDLARDYVESEQPE